MCGAQRCRPARTQIVKIRLARLNAVVEIGVTDLVSHHQNVNRQTDAKVERMVESIEIRLVLSASYNSTS